ncbi:uracil-DNA glycosylase family protein [Catenovulum sp. 2E275]|uniref:uracil-DNA glycosylase family protein n=1 Tax=Catenovulum sp. 2E275 TaxID=2980497 RepID=UPI0021D3A731|nr:uracil-DNA glycosylase family protein [Catenovulum sp. 2E275]MCU4675671.1 uracil-DNA glycosylase family protein [Catenovulum sp. 2E275]
MSFETLHQQILACRHCQAQLTPNPVLQINPKAKILIAGQAPGRVADKANKPFADASGKRLKQWLGINDDVFYDPAQIAILPMAFCFPGSGKSGDLAPPKICAQLWREKVLAYLTEVKLTIVLGQYARAYHLGKNKLNLTQAVAEQNLTTDKTILLPHPSPRNQHWFKQNTWFESDLLPQLQAQVKQLI